MVLEDILTAFKCCQVLNVSFHKFHLSSAFVYIRKTPTQEETSKIAQSLSGRDLVIGDLNLDKNRAEDVKKIDILCQKRSQVLDEITTVWFNQLDHVLLDKTLFPCHFATSFRNHTTDHHAIAFRVPEVGAQFSNSFLSKINFDREHWTKTKHQKRKFNESEDRDAPTNKRNKANNGITNMNDLYSPNWLTSETIDN